MKFVHITTAHAMKHIRRGGIRSSPTGRRYREGPAGGYVFCMPLAMIPYVSLDDRAPGGSIDRGKVPAGGHWPRNLRCRGGVKGSGDLRRMVALVFTPGADNWPAIFSMPALYGSERSDVVDFASTLGGVERNTLAPRHQLEFRVGTSKALGLLMQRFFDAHGGIDKSEWDFEVRLRGPVRPNRIHRTVPLHRVGERRPDRANRWRGEHQV
ncbi:MAG: hypothetical protein AAGH64_00105 [Planctomycetota bacterium]